MRRSREQKTGPGSVSVIRLLAGIAFDVFDHRVDIATLCVDDDRSAAVSHILGEPGVEADKSPASNHVEHV